VKHVLSGADHQSNVDRPLPHRRLLRERGEQIYILQLQGFIFFGTAHHLLTQITVREDAPNLLPLRFVILDFRRVSGLDSSAVLSFVKMSRLAQKRTFTVVATQMAPAIRSQLAVSGLVDDPQGALRIFPDLDHGLEWCENRLLTGAALFPEGERWTLEDLQRAVPSPLRWDQLSAHLERLSVGAGQCIIQQGATAADLYFIESGQVTVRVELDDGRSVRLRTMGPGTVVGEIGLYLRQVRSASVVADEPTVVHRLTAEALERMERNAPDAAAALHKFIAQMLAERLANTNKTLQALLD